MSALHVSGPADHRHERGFALLDALAALALLSLIALGAAQLLALSRTRLDEARHLQDATALAARVLDELSLVGWHGLPARFGVEASRSEAQLDSSRGELPADWQEALDEIRLPGSRLVVSLEGLGQGGTRRSYEQSVGLRLEALVEWDTRASRRRVRLVSARF